MYSSFLHNKFKQETSSKAKCFGIINLTPDSFSDASNLYLDKEFQLNKIQSCIDLGIDFIDIGAESTRPGAQAISVEEEYSRLESFLDIYDAKLPLSLDCRKAGVLKRVFAHKNSSRIKYINDISGMQDREFLELCSRANLETQFIAMHSKGPIPPEKVDDDYYQEDRGLEAHMMSFFEKTISLCESYGITKDRLILDPGFGFAKNFKHSFDLIDIIPKLKREFALPIFVGSSRKSFLKSWESKITQLGFEELDNKELDILTIEFNELLDNVDYFRMHLPVRVYFAH